MRADVERLSEIFSDLTAKSDVHRLGWPNAPDLASRYEALLSAVDFNAYSESRPLKLLDLGCGYGLLLDWLSENGLLGSVEYTGVDLVGSILEAARQRWPGHRFDWRDVRDQAYADGAFDYCIICGIFIAKYGNSYEDTVALAQGTLKAVWPSVTLGLAFNSMSKHVDWERHDLFHWPLDEIMAFCKRDLCRHASFRLDYGPWEVATLVRKQPFERTSKVPQRW
jgi:SAM-dependent methyltransferase